MKNRKNIFKLIILAAIAALFVATPSLAFAADEEPVWFSNFAAEGDTVYIPDGYESFVSGKKQNEGLPEVLKEKETDVLSVGVFCFYGDKIYYSLLGNAGEGSSMDIYLCDLYGENDVLLADDADGLSAVICNNILYYRGYDYYYDESIGYNWFKEAIYKIDLSDLSSKELLVETGPFDPSLRGEWLEFYYFDGEWLFYETGSGYYKMDANGNNITAVSGDLDEFNKRTYSKAKIYGDKTYYIGNGTLYEKDRNGGNAMKICDIVGKNPYILSVTEDYVYYCTAYKYVFAVKKPTISVVLNGTELEFDQAPIIINDRVMVPMRTIFEAMDYDVEWNQESQTAKATKGGDIITVQIGSNEVNYTLNGKSGTYVCDTEPQIINNRTLVPVRTIAESAGCNVEWDNDTRTVNIE